MASWAGNTRPVKHHSSAVCRPTSRGRNQDEAASGVMPRRAKTKPKRASVEARRMSMASCMVTPTPTAGPFTAAITGLRLSKMRKVSRPPPSRCTPPTRACRADGVACSAVVESARAGRTGQPRRRSRARRR